MTCEINVYTPQLVVINKFSCKLEDVARTKAALSSYKSQVTQKNDTERLLESNPTI